jgi:hypothetical protein
MSRKVYIDRTLDMSPDDMQIIFKFCHACMTDLTLDCDFSVKIVEDKVKNGIKTTAYYNPENNLICVLGKGRHVLDICRSIAHEMTHMMQNERGLITGPIKDVGGFHEDQANSKAGEIVKKFIYKMGL